MSSLLVITGPPGAGKSAVASAIAQRLEGSALIEGDLFFGFLGERLIPPWLPQAHLQNGVIMDAAAQAAGTLADAGFAVVFDGVVGPWFLSRFMAGARVDQLEYAVLLPLLDVCLERVAIREAHGFDNQEATIRMHRDFADADIGSRHVFSRHDANPEILANEVMGQRRRGLLAYRAS